VLHFFSLKLIMLASLMSNQLLSTCMLMSNEATGSSRTPILSGPGISASNSSTPSTTGATVVGNPPEEPSAREVLVTCDGHVSDYWNSCISKAAALAYIHTSLANVLPEGSKAVECPFAQYIAILENHDQFIAAAGGCGIREWSVGS
jgi:hypothetical protein